MGQSTLVEGLLSKGADIEMDGGTGTGLVEIANEGHEVITKFLFINQTNVKSGNGAALYRAIEKGHDKVVELLLQWNARLISLDRPESNLYIRKRAGAIR